MYTANKVSDRLIVIGEREGESSIYSMQLVIGDERAALVDTGVGFEKNLDAFVKQFTDLPVTVLLTHGHHDHYGNADLFGKVYMDDRDSALLEESAFKYKHIEDGDSFDLGGVTLFAVSLPGHTPGSVCFIDKQNKFAFTGDAVNQHTWLWWDYCLTPAEYAVSLRGFAAKLDEYGIKDIYHGHSMEKLPPAILEDMISALCEIAAGKTADDENYRFSFAVDTADKIYQHKHGNSLIVYTKS
ncbi:hypothetical protein FACS189490_14050 [Clostridia bacterium]|nr:hypothetical protein FACS189490_14050 [Clostridia bacterium]